MNKMIESLNESARKVHGKDISFAVARSIAFGHQDNCVIIKGKNHKVAALDFIISIDRTGKTGKHIEQRDTYFAHVYSVVTF